MEKNSKLWSIFVLGPLVLAPVLAVEFPRILAYLPLLPMIFGAFIILRENLAITIPKKPLIVLIMFLGFLSLNTFVIAPSEDALDRFKNLLMIFGFGSAFLLVLYFGRELSNKNLIKWLMVSCAIGALFICFELLFHTPVYKLTRPDMLPDDYTMAVFNRGSIVITFISLVTLFAGKGTYGKSLYLLYLPVLLMLFLVESQSAQIAAIGGLIFFFVFPFKKKWAWQVFYILLVLGMFGKPFIVQSVYKTLPDNIHENAFLQEAYVGNRIEIWDFISKEALKKPILGHGLEFTKGYDEFETDQRFLSSNKILHPHSFILQIWIELGVAGVIAFLGFSACLIKNIYKMNNERLKRASLSMFAVITLVYSFSYGMWQSWWLGLVFIIAGIILSLFDNQKHNA